MKLSLYSYKLPLKKPLFLKGKSISSRRGWILQLQDQYQIKLAEASPLPFFSTESFEEVQKQLYSFFLEGKKPKVFFPSVRFALSSLLGPSLSLCPLEFAQLLFDVTPKLDSSCIKIKYKPPLPDFIAWVKELKKKYPKHKIRLDINQKWSLEEGLAFAKAFKIEDFSYLEEPFSLKEELFSFSEKTGFPLALDESLQRKDKEDFFLLPSLKALVIKPTLLGGLPFSLWKKKKIPFVFSSSLESSIGLHQIARLAKRAKAPIEPIGLDTFSLFLQDTVKKPPEKKGGKLYFFTEQLQPKVLCHHFTVLFKLPMKSLLPL